MINCLSCDHQNPVSSCECANCKASLASERSLYFFNKKRELEHKGLSGTRLFMKSMLLNGEAVSMARTPASCSAGEACVIRTLPALQLQDICAALARETLDFALLRGLLGELKSSLDSSLSLLEDAPDSDAVIQVYQGIKVMRELLGYVYAYEQSHNAHSLTFCLTVAMEMDRLIYEGCSLIEKA